MVAALRRCCCLFVFLLAAAPLQARAEDPPFLTVGAGYYDLVQQDNTATEFRVEYRDDRKLWIFKPFVGAMTTTDFAFYGYGGVYVDVFLGRRFVVTPNFAAGYYHDGNGRDLGYGLEFRSAIDVAYRFDDRTRLGLSFYHISNASLGDKNPGTEVLSVVYSIPLGPGK